PSWLLPAAKVRRKSNIGNSWASTKSPLAPPPVCHLWMSSLRRGRGWSARSSCDSRRVSSCCLAVAWPDSAGVATFFAGGMEATVSPVSLSQAARPKAQSRARPYRPRRSRLRSLIAGLLGQNMGNAQARSEEHTSELQSRENLVCRLLLEK